MLDKLSQVLSSEQLTEPKSLDVALNIAGVEKIRSENLRLQSTWRPSKSSFERKRSVSDLVSFVVWNRSETPFSCNTVGRELYFARCCALKQTRTFASESKVMCLFKLTYLEKWCFVVWHSRHQSVGQQLFWDWEKLNLLIELISETFWLLGLLNSR